MTALEGVEKLPEYVFCLQNDLLRESLFSRLRSQNGLKTVIKGRSVCVTGQAEDLGTDRISSMLADFILTDREKYVIWEKTYAVFDCFSPEEKKTLADKAIDHAANDTFTWSVFAGPRRKEKLVKVLADYLARSDYLDLDGFVAFRLTGYKEYLMAVLAVVADDYLGYQEDHEYRLLLQDILASRKTFCHELHLLLTAKGFFQIYKKEKNRYILVESGKIAGYEDLLISEMIMLAPGKLFLYCDDKERGGLISRSLAEVFNERLEYCEGTAIKKE